MTLAALHAIVPVWSIVGLNYCKSFMFTLSTDEITCVLAEAYILAGWLDICNISSSWWSPFKIRLRNCLSSVTEYVPFSMLYLIVLSSFSVEFRMTTDKSLSPFIATKYFYWVKFFKLWYVQSFAWYTILVKMSV